MKQRALRCTTCGRLTDPEELATRPLPANTKDLGESRAQAARGVRDGRLGCAYCGADQFKVEMIDAT